MNSDIVLSPLLVAIVLAEPLVHPFFLLADQLLIDANDPSNYRYDLRSNNSMTRKVLKELSRRGDLY